MRDVEKELKDAFRSMSVPDGLNEKTLQMIERKRAQRESDARVDGKDAGVRSVEAHRGEPRSAYGSDSEITERPTGAPASVAAASGKRTGAGARRRGWVVRFAAVAACLAIAVLGVTGYGIVKTPVAFVDIDVNPSIGLEVNRFNDVVGARAYNSDGQAVLESVDVVGMSCEEALDALATSDSLGRYLASDSYMEISVAGDDAVQVEELVAWGSASLSKAPCEGSCAPVSSADREEAHAHHMGMGKYRAAKALAAADPSVSVEDCSDMSMRELRDRLETAGVEDSMICDGGCAEEGCGEAPGHREQARDRGSDGAGEGHRGEGA